MKREKGAKKSVICELEQKGEGERERERERERHTHTHTHKERSNGVNNCIGAIDDDIYCCASDEHGGTRNLIFLH